MKQAFQFTSLEQQKDAATVGMWIFLGSETLFFGGIFLACAVYRALYPDVFAEATKHLSLFLGTANTSLLLTSSFTMAMAVERSQEQGRKAFPWLLATMLLGVSFLVIKGIEYRREFHEHLFPGINFATEKFTSNRAVLFFLLYFIGTAIHALHLSIGIFLVGWCASPCWKKQAPSHSRVELIGLYWHFVDLVWIFLYPTLYLLGRS